MNTNQNILTAPTPLTMLITSLTLEQAKTWDAEADKVVWIIDNLLDPANINPLLKTIDRIETRFENLINGSN